jgi:hypothetical protein
MGYVCKKYLYNKKRSIARQDDKLARRKNYGELANGESPVDSEDSTARALAIFLVLPALLTFPLITNHYLVLAFSEIVTTDD